MSGGWEKNRKADVPLQGQFFYVQLQLQSQDIYYGDRRGNKQPWVEGVHTQFPKAIAMLNWLR